VIHRATVAINGRLSQFLNITTSQTFLALSFNIISLLTVGLMLATVLHLGLVEPRLKDNMDTYYPLVKSVLVITIIDALILDTFSFIFNFISGNVDFAVFYFLC
jgi:hypothetical protein